MGAGSVEPAARPGERREEGTLTGSTHYGSKGNGSNQNYTVDIIVWAIIATVILTCYIYLKCC